MEYIIAHFKNDSFYIEHYELMIKRKLGYEPVMTFHPMVGNRPKMFESENEAMNFLKSEKTIFSFNDNSKYKIVFVPENSEYIQHFEIFEKNFLSWKPIMTFHPMSGDRPKMFDTWGQVDSYIKDLTSEHSSTKKFKP